uniref:Helicase C-terminal domain-containing protein n=1 Tax=viral metagenome TaxID=1070528 RepID=A0A6C0DQX9_9ZZZZ
MNIPFQPSELIMKPMPKQQNHFRINMKIPVDSDAQITIVDEEVAPITAAKSVIVDKRKYSNIERSLVLDRIRCRNSVVGIVSEEYPDFKSCEKPIGQPSVIEEAILPKPPIKKLEKEVVLREPVEEGEEEIPEIKVETKDVSESHSDEEEEMKEFEKLLEEPPIVKKEPNVKAKAKAKATEKETEKPDENREPTKAEKTEEPKVRKLRIKAKKQEDDLINVDLKTVAINQRMLNERLPAPREKIIIKAPSYYMTNRKLYVGKLNQLFQPYRDEITRTTETASCDSRTSDAEFELLTHQKIVRDYLNIYTPYRGLLLYHGLGSGKSCSSIAIAEGMKSDKRVVLMTPASLKMNFFTELKKCGDHMYKKNQFWEFVSIEGKPEYIPILAKALSLTTENIRERGGAWLVDITKSANFSEKRPSEQKDIDDQLNQMIRSKYIDINYNGINLKGLEKLSANFTINPFDNTVVIIDEAHNFVSRIVNKVKGTKKDSVAYRMYDYLMNATNAKVVLLTGTPIINYPNEIGVLYNILRGYIKTWEMTVNVKTAEKINTDTILDIFDKENFRFYDYVEYSGNKLTITRNPFGFINTKKRGAVKKGVVRSGGGKKKETRKLNENSRNRKTKKLHSFEKESYDIEVENGVVQKLTFEEDDNIDPELSAEHSDRIGYNFDNNPYKGGGSGDAFDKYNGVKLDETGNITDSQFEETLIRILTKHGLEVPPGLIEVKKFKVLNDDADLFLNAFVNVDTAEVKNMDVFQRRILGLTSYFRSAQESLLPSFVKTDEGDIFHIVKCIMTDHQFGVYEKIRKIEAEQEKRNRKNKQRQQPGNDLFNISSTYRIFSRSACNFAFPSNIERPLPSGKTSANEEGSTDYDIDENDFNAVPLNVRKQADEEDIEDIEQEQSQGKDVALETYQERIEHALGILAYNPESPRDAEYLTKESLLQFSPKFVELLTRIQNQDYSGLHLIYSQFRTIEGIGIIKLILEANGFAEFKLQRIKQGETEEENSWEIVENPANSGKPKFVLYTGTETTEEKEIIRNIYNSAWEFVPSNIAMRLREMGDNNFMGEIIKIFMITSSGAEGINLRNTRYVHIVEPYWNMTRIEQVVGRARRICSHQDLPEELRTVQVFLYISTLSEEQKVSESNIELRIRDVSKLDKKTPITTDESLFEIASMKDKINRQILKAVKESAMDCSLYAGKNKDEPLVCYGYGKVESNQFGSYPSLDKDMGEKSDLNVREVKVKLKKFKLEGQDYAFNPDTTEVFDYESYENALKTGSEMILIGKLVRKGKGFKLERV